MARPRLDSYRSRAFSVAAPLLWNELLYYITGEQTLTFFKAKLTTHIFSEAFHQRQYNVHNMFHYFKMLITYFVYKIVLADFNGFIIRYIWYNLANCHAPMNVPRMDLGAL